MKTSTWYTTLRWTLSGIVIGGFLWPFMFVAANLGDTYGPALHALAVVLGTGGFIMLLFSALTLLIAAFWYDDSSTSERRG